jgi:hypothetical protein
VNHLDHLDKYVVDETPAMHYSSPMLVYLSNEEQDLGTIVTSCGHNVIACLFHARLA